MVTYGAYKTDHLTHGTQTVLLRVCGNRSGGHMTHTHHPPRKCTRQSQIRRNSVLGLFVYNNKVNIWLRISVSLGMRWDLICWLKEIFPWVVLTNCLKHYDGSASSRIGWDYNRASFWNCWGSVDARIPGNRQIANNHTSFVLISARSFISKGGRLGCHANSEYAFRREMPLLALSTLQRFRFTKRSN